MALCLLARRLHHLHRSPPFFSLASRPTFHPHICSSSVTPHANFFFSQAFRRTLVTHTHTNSQNLNFSTLQSSSVQSLYNPIDFSDFEIKSNTKDQVGVLEVVELVKKAKDCTSIKESIDFLGSSGVQPDAQQFCLAVWELRNDWELALLGFKWSEKWGLFDDKSLSLIVWVLSTHHKFDIAWSLIRDLHKLVDTRQAMLAIIERYAASNSHEKAIKTFHFMEKLTVSPDQNAFYSVMSALCRYGNVEEAEEFMLKNKKMYPLETEGFNIILHGWCDISVDVFEAKRVWREMAGYCITPDARSYTHMISCFSRVGNLFDSLRLYDEMRKRGWVPGLEVYNSLIYVMTRENCLSEALKMLDKIKETGLQPASQTFNSLICPLCEAGKFEEARRLLALMTQEGNRPTVETYQAFLKGANLESTLEFLNLMKKDKVGPDSCTFLLIFDRFFELRQPENALKVWVEMRDLGVYPESAHYLSLIRGLANCGCLIKARELHTEMNSYGLVDDPKLKKLLQAPQESSCRGRIGPVKTVRCVNKLESPFTSHIKPHRGRRNRGGKREREEAKG